MRKLLTFLTIYICLIGLVVTIETEPSRKVIHYVKNSTFVDAISKRQEKFQKRGIINYSQVTDDCNDKLYMARKSN
jgi:hypothetical protein